MPTLTTAREATRDNGVKIMTYGPSGVGKTVLCGTLPDSLIISLEQGLLSLRKTSPNHPVLLVDDVEELTEVHAWLAGSAEARRDYCGIHLDSLSEFAELLLARALPETREPRQAYNTAQVNVLALCRSFRDLPGYHVHVTCKEGPTTDTAGVVRFGPLLTGKKLPIDVPYLFDEVFRLAIGECDGEVKTYRYLATQPDTVFVAKDRSGSLDAQEKPDLSYIINKISKT